MLLRDTEASVARAGSMPSKADMFLSTPLDYTFAISAVTFNHTLCCDH